MTDPDTGRAVRFPLELGAVRQFARAVLQDDAESIEVGSPIPVTFLMSVAHWMGPEDRVSTGFDRARLLHGGQDIILPDGPPKVGDVLIAQERIVDKYEKQGEKGGKMRFAVISTFYTNEHDGRVVAEMRSTLIERSAKP